jgi:hypothetical protein
VSAGASRDEKRDVIAGGMPGREVVLSTRCSALGNPPCGCDRITTGKKKWGAGETPALFYIVEEMSGWVVHRNYTTHTQERAAMAQLTLKMPDKPRNY